MSKTTCLLIAVAMSMILSINFYMQLRQRLDKSVDFTFKLADEILINDKKTNDLVDCAMGAELNTKDLIDIVRELIERTKKLEDNKELRDVKN